MHLVRYAISALLIFFDEAARSEEWRYYGADAGSSKYAPLSQISADNFNRLHEVWRYEPPDGALAKSGGASNFNNKGTPLMVDGVLYYDSPHNILCALDPSYYSARAATSIWARACVAASTAIATASHHRRSSAAMWW